MLLCLWSPKGGSGVSVFAAACALVLARMTGARLADLGGDQPSILGLGADPATGLRDWLRVGPEAPTDALDRLAFDAARGLSLLPAGTGALAPAAPEAGAALGVALRAEDVPTIVDVGALEAPAADALVEVADVAVVVVRACYLSLRRAVRSEATLRSAGVVLIEEPGRSLGEREVADVLGLPVLAKVPVRASVARVVDAGVLAARMPDALVRPARQFVARITGTERKGRVA